ncbi:MAG: ROK family transcriptional regulator [Shimia sp.]
MTILPDPPGSNAERTRAYNKGLVLGHLRRGEAGRAEIARASGLSTQAVSNIIADLATEGWVCESGRRSAGRGLPVTTYAIRPEAGTALGLEIRPDVLLATLIDLGGTTLWQTRVPLPEATPGEVLPRAARALADGLVAVRLSRPALIGAGAVMPGPFGRTGLSAQGTTLPGWAGEDAAGLLSGALDLPVTVENDANAAAMAERLSGVARTCDSFAYLYFGAGLGLGLVTGGRIFHGGFGDAGEIGHVPVPTPDGPRDLEQVAGRIALRRALVGAGLPADTVDDLARVRGSAAYAAWRDGACAALGHAVLMVENLLDPETVILGGALPAPILDDLVRGTPLREASLANRPDRAQPRLMTGTAGRMTATVGAAALVVDAALSPRLSLTA